ncbi:MAG: SEC-C domain-containing protein [Solirubrobacteraceae bacterium]|nr:SEC-C domain-containing protein [Solirubrobacteraceae bacterium]
MARPAVDRLFMRVVEAETLGDAVAALEELAALDDADPSAIHEHQPIGDLYSELAGELFEDEEVETAIELQEEALMHPCTNRRREQGTLLGYRFVGLEDTSALDDLKASRSGGPSDASLLAGFAEQVEVIELAMALRLHDEALEIAQSARPVDEELLRSVEIGRALARSDAGLPPDDSDLAAEDELAKFDREARLADARDARQLFVPRDQLAAAREQWPDELDFADEAVYYATLERRWQERPGDAGKPKPYPVDVAVFAAAGATPTRLLDDLPQDLVLTIEAAGTGPVTWPPGRNDDCWCGSGRKYKKCCG